MHTSTSKHLFSQWTRTRNKNTQKQTYTSTSDQKKFNQTFGFYHFREGKDLFNLTLKKILRQWMFRFFFLNALRAFFRRTFAESLFPCTKHLVSVKKILIFKGMAIYGIFENQTPNIFFSGEQNSFLTSNFSYNFAMFI